MLTPKEKPPRKNRTVVVSFRLTEEEDQHLLWLMAKLNRTKTEVLEDLIEQEYEAQGDACRQPFP